MKITMQRLIVVAILFLPLLGRAEVAPENVKYKAGKDVNFEELLIQGQLKRPEVTVVTGNTQQNADGLLRLRKDFLDRMAIDAAEEP